jgi:TolB-like protein/DNA-binding SARP family transcriptional activator
LGLLAILGLGGRQGLSRERIETYLWPESSSTLARHALDQTVYAIRHALGSDFILSTGRELRLNPELVQSDVWQFEEAIRTRQWGTAVGHYKGPLLDGFHFADSRELESWIDTERARLRLEYQTAIEFLATQSAEAGDHSRSVTWWRRLANSDPLSAGATKKLILALAAAGDRAGAVKHARLYQELVRQELEIEPDSEIEDLASTLSHSAINPTVGTAARARATDFVPSPPSDTPKEPRFVTSNGTTTPHIGAATPRTVGKSESRGLVTAVGLALVLLTLASSAWYWYDHKIPVVAAVAADTTPSLAVLPFENLGKSGDAYFADGMTEEISSRLGTVSGLRLIGRQSAKSYANTSKSVAQIGKELGVAYLLMGTVRWDRSRAGHSVVKVSPELVRVSDGAQMWSEPYQSELTGVFEIQGKVAEQVAQALQLQLSEGQQRTLTSRTVGAGLTAQESRSIWPAVRNPEFARYMQMVAEPAEEEQRLGYFVSKVELAVYQSNATARRQFADSIILYVPGSLRGNFFDGEKHAELSLAYGAKGDKPKTLEEGRRAMGIMPFDRDAQRWAENLEVIVEADVLVGANDEAFGGLRQLLSASSESSPAWLRVDPWFEPLRGDPRFKQLVSAR